MLFSFFRCRIAAAFFVLGLTGREVAGMTSETYGAFARSDRFDRLKMGAALLSRAAVDAYVGFISRDADFLSSAHLCARLALELCMTKGVPAS